jgi:hypothetical protein
MIPAATVSLGPQRLQGGQPVAQRALAAPVRDRELVHPVPQGGDDRVQLLVQAIGPVGDRLVGEPVGQPLRLDRAAPLRRDRHQVALGDRGGVDLLEEVGRAVGETALALDAPRDVGVRDQLRGRGDVARRVVGVADQAEAHEGLVA